MTLSSGLAPSIHLDSNSYSPELTINVYSYIWFGIIRFFSGSTKHLFMFFFDFAPSVTSKLCKKDRLMIAHLIVNLLIFKCFIGQNFHDSFRCFDALDCSDTDLSSSFKMPPIKKTNICSIYSFFEAEDNVSTLILFLFY